jgi:drug/metabolite transporter (DMT)-like permease
VFTADPAFGFPPGTPAGYPTSVSWHGNVHLLVASVAFLALIVACFVFGRRFRRAGRQLSALGSVGAGVLLLIAFGANGAMPGQPVSTVGFTSAALLAFLWASAVSYSLLGGVAAGRRGDPVA